MGIKLGNLQLNKHEDKKTLYSSLRYNLRKILYKMHIHGMKLFRITKNGGTIVCTVQSSNYNPEVEKISIRNSKDKHSMNRTNMCRRNQCKYLIIIYNIIILTNYCVN